MNIAKGITGIRKYLATNSSGWHIASKDGYHEFLPNTLMEMFELPQYDGYTLIGINGNLLWIAKRGQK